MPTDSVTLAFLFSSLTHSIKVYLHSRGLSHCFRSAETAPFCNCTMCLFTASETKDPWTLEHFPLPKVCSRPLFVSFVEDSDITKDKNEWPSRYTVILFMMQSSQICMPVKVVVVDLLACNIPPGFGVYQGTFSAITLLSFDFLSCRQSSESRDKECFMLCIAPSSEGAVENMAVGRQRLCSIV